MYKSDTFWRICLVTLVILGIGLRVVNLDQKVFWHDEVYTAIPVAGYTRRGVNQDWLRSFLDKGETLTAAELSRYQTPNAGTNMGHLLRSLRLEEPQNSPLYFALSRLLLQLTQGSPVTGMRGLSVLFSLLTIPATFWLCRELFTDHLTPYLAISLMAVSPFQILYAQEARQYSLMTLGIVLSSAILLRAIRSNRTGLWLLYAATTAIALYAQPLFIFVTVAHGVYVGYGRLSIRYQALSQKSELSPATASAHPNSANAEASLAKSAFKRFLQAIAIGYLAYLPWLIIVVTNTSSISDWRKKTVLPFMQLAGRWILNIGRSFYDVPLPSPNQYNLPLEGPQAVTIGTLLVFGLVVYAFYCLIKQTAYQTWLFITSLAIAPSLLFIGLDCVLGGVRSTVPRYFGACYVALGLAVAYCLSQGITRSPNRFLRQLWLVIAIALLTVSSLSSVRLVQAATWWTKYSDYNNVEVAAIINAAPNPIVIGANRIRLISLSYELNEATPVQLLNTDEASLAAIAMPQLSQRLGQSPEDINVFVYDSADLASALAATGEYCPIQVFDQPLYFIDQAAMLWRAPLCEPTLSRR